MKRLVTAIVIALLLCGVLPSIFNVKPAKCAEVLFSESFDTYAAGFPPPSPWQNSIINDYGAPASYDHTIKVSNVSSLSNPNSLYLRGDFWVLSSMIDGLEGAIGLNISIQNNGQWNGGNNHVFGTYVILEDSQGNRILHLHMGASTGDPNYHVWVSNDSYQYYYYDPNLGGWYWRWANEVELYSAPQSNSGWDHFQFIMLNSTYYQVFWNAQSSSGNLTLRTNNSTGPISRLVLFVQECGGAYFDDISVYGVPLVSTSISPISTSIDIGQSVTFVATTSEGTPPYTYQWYLNDNPVLGANSTSWTFTPAATGSFTVHLNVTDNLGNIAKSNDASVTVATQLSASITPLSASIYVDDSVVFTSTVNGGTPPYTYQWCLNDIPISGATSTSWTFTPSTSGSYKVYLNVTDSLGNTAGSNQASVTVASQLTASISPMSASILVGQSVTFTSTAAGGYLPYSYQWYLNGAPVSGAMLSNWAFTPQQAESTTYTSKSQTLKATQRNLKQPA